MPVLPLWWTQGIGISTETYLSTLACVSLAALLLDIPMSLLADKIGNKVTLSAGLAIFSLSFIFAAFGRGESSFYAFAVSNTLAEGLLSGSSVALLREVAGEQEYRNELFALSRQYYLFTSVLFFIGVALYLVKPRLLLWLQAILLAAACASVLAISSARVSGNEKNSRQESKEVALDAYANEGFFRYVIGVLAVCLLFGYFNGLMQFQNRTIQLLASSLDMGSLNPLWLSAAFLFLGNVLTSLGVGKTIEQSLRAMPQTLITCLLLCMAAAASVLLSLNSVVAVFVGYCGICMLKGAYRSEYNELIVRVQPSRKHSASWISMINTIACIVASGLNLLVSLFSGDGVSAIQLIWAGAALACGIVTVPAFLISKNASLPMAAKGMSQKKSSILFDFNSHDAPVFVQEYPSAEYRDRTMLNYARIPSSGMSCAPLANGNKDAQAARFRNALCFERLDCPELKDANDRTLGNLERIGLIGDLMKRPPSNLPKTAADPNAMCPRSHLLETSSKLCSCRVFCHGDLNPGNVMIGEDRYWLVDWDLAGIGPRIYDEFALVFHPEVDAEINERLGEMNDLIARHDQCCPLHKIRMVDVVRKLIAAKLDDCASWPMSNEASDIMRGYQYLLDQLEKQESYEG